MADAFGQGVLVVSVDARDGWVAIRGWAEQSGVRAHDLVARMASLGVHRFVYTDIARDGTMTEPNFEGVADIVRLGEPVIASGGISSVDHLVRLAGLRVEGAIVGRALYTGALLLPEALEAVRVAPR
jgi:phosphoribosylformimino-5-aminoimidazole carboxamide ribotide isomerase